MVFHKNLIYYSDNCLKEPIFSIVQELLYKVGLPIISCSLKPLDFGRNIVLDLEPSIMTMFKQILTALEASKADTVFLCEHDVLYHPSRFEFNPPRDDTYYYNTNVWRWDYPHDRLITYKGLQSLSGLCANRQLLINHYKKRFEIIEQRGWEDGKDPSWARKIGYEPGKKKRRGGFADELTDLWQSPVPDIDIRHSKTLTPRKVWSKEFIHQPENWQEIKIKELTQWNFQSLF